VVKSGLRPSRTEVTIKKLGLILLLVGLPLFGYWFLPKKPPLVPGATLENFRRLHKGMSIDEAITILGPTEEQEPAWKFYTIGIYFWNGEAGRIQLYFDLKVHNKPAEGKLLSYGQFDIGNEYREELKEEPISIFSRIRRLLGLEPESFFMP
jgi:hypothetical protein